MKQVRRVGLTAMMALVLTAIFGTAMASASVFESGAAPTEIKGTSTTEQIFNTPGWKTVCSEGSFSGENKGLTSQEFTTSSLQYSKCNGTAKTNGCQLTFHPKTEKSASIFNGTVDIGPPGCGPITVTWGISCSRSIYPKTGLKATFENTGAGNERAVKVSVESGGIHVTGTCESTSDSGFYTGGWLLKSYAGGSQKSLRVVPGFGAGIFVQSEAFTGEALPRAISGSQSAQLYFSTPEGSVKCQEAAFSANLASQSATLPVGAVYGKCSVFGFSGPVAMNSCHYVFQVSSGGPPYKGSVSLACDKAGDVVTATAILFGSTICTMSMPAQTLGTVEYENVGSGEARHVLAKIKGSKLKYSGTGGVCGKPSGNENGTLEGTIDLVGIE